MVSSLPVFLHLRVANSILIPRKKPVSSVNACQQRQQLTKMNDSLQKPF